MPAARAGTIPAHSHLMWNSNRIALEARLRGSQNGGPEVATATHHPQAAVLEDDTPELLSENRASAVASEDVAFAYAALLADQEAFRTRLEREKTRVIEAEKASLAQVLLDSTDDLERALKAVDVNGVCDRGLLNLMDGVRLSLAVLRKRIGDMGAERMSTTGQRFDPAFAKPLARSTSRIRPNMEPSWKRCGLDIEWGIDSFAQLKYAWVNWREK